MVSNLKWTFAPLLLLCFGFWGHISSWTQGKVFEMISLKLKMKSCRRLGLLALTGITVARVHRSLAGSQISATEILSKTFSGPPMDKNMRKTPKMIESFFRIIEHFTLHPRSFNKVNRASCWFTYTYSMSVGFPFKELLLCDYSMWWDDCLVTIFFIKQSRNRKHNFCMYTHSR